MSVRSVRYVTHSLTSLKLKMHSNTVTIESLVSRALDDVKFATELDTETEAVTRDKAERHREIEELDRLRLMQTKSEHEIQIRALQDDHTDRRNKAHEDHAKVFRTLSEDLSANVESLRKDCSSSDNAIHNHFDNVLASLHETHDANLEKARRVRDEQIENAREHYESSVESVRMEESKSIQEHERAIANELDELNEDISKRERAIESLVHRALDDVKYASELDDEVTAVTRDKVERHREIEELDRLRRIQKKDEHETQIRELKDAHTEMKHKAHEEHATMFRTLSEDLSSSVVALRKQRSDSFSLGTVVPMERKKSFEMSSISRFAVKLKRHATMAKADALLRDASNLSSESASTRVDNSTKSKLGNLSEDVDSALNEDFKEESSIDFEETLKDLSDLSRELREDDAPSNDDNPSSLPTSSMEESNKEKSDVESNVLKDREDVTDELKEDDAPSNNDNPSSLPTNSMEESNKEKFDVESNVLKDRKDLIDDDLKEVLKDDENLKETLKDEVTEEDLKETLQDVSDLLPDLRDKESEDIITVERRERNVMITTTEEENDSLNMSLKVLMESDFAPVSSDSSGIDKYADAMMDVVLSREQNVLDNEDDIELPPTPPSPQLETSSSLNDVKQDEENETSILLEQNDDEIVYRNDDNIHDDNQSNKSSSSYAQEDIRVTSFEEQDEGDQKLIHKLSPIQEEQEEDTWRDMKDGHDMRDVISGGGYYSDGESNDTTTTFKLYKRSRRIQIGNRHIEIGNNGITIDLMNNEEEDEEKEDLPSRTTSRLLDKIERDRREPHGWWVKF